MAYDRDADTYWSLRAGQWVKLSTESADVALADRLSRHQHVLADMCTAVADAVLMDDERALSKQLRSRKIPFYAGIRQALDSIFADANAAADAC